MSKETGPAAELGIYDELRPLFYPDSVAVVGVSQDAWKPGSSMLRALLRFGFPGRLYPVSNRGGVLMGLDVYQSIASLPEAVDLAFLFVPAPALPSVVRECREKGVKAIVAFTGGFSEMGTEAGKALEFDGSFRMVGPNCLGLYCPAGGVTQHPGGGYSRESGEVSFIAQSGGLSEDFARAAPNFGFYASKVISYGNACDLNEADLLEYMGADPDTGIIGMYIEGPRNGRKFAEVLRRVGARKPVVVWKGGLTPQGATAASSHTGSLAGSLEVWGAVLRQSGAVQVSSMEELLDTLEAFHFLPGHADLRVGYVCAGGGNSVAAGDASYQAGLALPHMSPETRDKIASFLPPVGSSSTNPVDVLAPMPSAPALKGVLEAMAGSGEVGVIIVDKIVLSKELRRLMNYADQTPTEDEPWLSEIPVDVQRSRRRGCDCAATIRRTASPCIPRRTGRFGRLATLSATIGGVRQHERQQQHRADRGSSGPRAEEPERT
jgi:acyl-CoA synthetase (NDP forming)